MKQLTADAIKAAAVKAGSLTKLGYELGFPSKINGGAIKQIKALVPDIMDRLGKPLPAVKAPEAKEVKTIKMTRVPKVTGDSPYRGAYGILFGQAKEFAPREEIIQRAAKASGKDEKLVLISYNVLRNPNHRSNGGRSKEEAAADGKVRLVAISQ